MRKSLREWTLAVLLPALLATGCTKQREFYFFDKHDMSYYVDVATQIEHPDLSCSCVETIPTPDRPFNLETFGEHEFWDLTLNEAVQIALDNSKVIRQVNLVGGGAQLGFAGRPFVPQATDRALSAPQTLPTIFDSAIQESNVVGPIGVEAALAAFDAQLRASMFWERRERPVNVGGEFGDLIFAPTAEQDLANFQAELSKQTAAGGRFYLQNNVNYQFSNSPTRAVPSDYYLDYIVGFQQPLLQGAGVGFNRIAGPNAIPGVNNGVLIARINQDQELVQFEVGVRNMVSDVENMYWLLYQTYRSLDAARAARDSARADWERVMLLRERGARGGDKQSEALARAQFLRFQGELENALIDLYRAENRLRYLLGIPATNGKVIRPIDEPTMARVTFDWNEVHVEALARTAELRGQKWQIKRRELELIAARNFLLPRLDAVALYRWLGQGDRLLDPNGRPIPPYEGSDAFATLTSGDYQEWQLGFQFNMPLGFRREMTNVRNSQLQLAREHARLHQQELEVSQLLTEAVRNLEAQYRLSQTLYSSWTAAYDEYIAVREQVAVGVAIDNDVIDALSRLVQAENQFYNSLTQYNRAIIEVHFRKGSLLEYNGIYLAEGPWPAKAYADARERARARSQPPQLNYCMPQRPGIVSSGPEFGPAELLPAPLQFTEEAVDAPPAGAAAEHELPDADLGREGPPNRLPLEGPGNGASPGDMPPARPAPSPPAPAPPDGFSPSASTRSEQRGSLRTVTTTDDLPPNIRAAAEAVRRTNRVMIGQGE